MVNNGLVLLNVVGELRILEYKTRMRRTRREILRTPGKARPTSNDARLETINTPFRWSNKPSKGLRVPSAPTFQAILDRCCSARGSLFPQKPLPSQFLRPH